MSAGGRVHGYSIRPSVILAVFLVLSASLLMCVIFTLPLWIVWKLAGMVSVTAVAGFVLMRDGWLRLPTSCRSFDLAPARRITLVLRSGLSVAGVIGASSFISPALIMLDIVTDSGQRRSLLILPDSMNAAEFRRLRARLRWGIADPLSQNHPQNLRT